jgi:hypothetical protein
MADERRNPHIETLCRALVAKQGERFEPDALERHIDSLYRLFENMLGRNMVAALPEELRKEFVARYDKGGRDVDLWEVGRVFEANVSDYEGIMRKTAQEFAALYIKNRPGEASPA